MKSTAGVLCVVLVRSVRGWSQKELVERLTCDLVSPLEGQVVDCGCSFAEVDESTNTYFGPILKNLTSGKFFRYFKIDLDKGCDFWPDDGQCERPECSIETECEELPEPWRREEEARKLWHSEQHYEEECSFFKDDDIPVDRYSTTKGWKETGGDEVWNDQDDNEDGMIYIDLIRNPEKYTGYDGEKARRIWRAIHEENCFQPAQSREFVVHAFRRLTNDQEEKLSDECLERRVFHRLFSGLQASVSTHIAVSHFSARDVLFKFTPPRERLSVFLGLAIDRILYNQKSSLNDPVFIARVGRHPERIHNLYFTYLFVLRAVSKAKDELATFDFSTGDPSDDEMTLALMKKLVYSTGFSSFQEEEDICVGKARLAFDESALFKVPEAVGMSPLEKALARESVEELRAEFLTRFRNITKIMNCVTCERCRLWGKLQVLGLGTALKILLLQGDESGIGTLQRNEVVALINTLAQLAKSVDSLRLWQRRAKLRATATAVFEVFICILLFALLYYLYSLLRSLSSSWYSSAPSSRMTPADEDTSNLSSPKVEPPSVSSPPSSSK